MAEQHLARFLHYLKLRRGALRSRKNSETRSRLSGVALRATNVRKSLGAAKAALQDPEGPFRVRGALRKGALGALRHQRPSTNAKHSIDLRFFRWVYIIAGVALAALSGVCWVAWGARAAAGMAAGGAISIAVLLSWQWLAMWIIGAPMGRAKRRLVIVWPLKYVAIGIILYALLRWNLVNVFALIAGLGLIQAVLFARALFSSRQLFGAPPKGRDEHARGT